ncbi:MAG: ribbon-helix-helix protein, CopG family [Thermoplasmata archaeon]|nr:ribbon-helix-helix protein, CopG family [Thermoplasmata archaeon]
MPVVSISLTDKNLTVLDKIRKDLGLAGRSEAVRVCLRSAEAEAKERDAISGEVEGVMIVIHRAEDGTDIDESRHDFQEIIRTQVHSHLKNGKCLDVFIVRGLGEKVKTMLVEFQKDEGLEYIKFLQS